MPKKQSQPNLYLSLAIAVILSFNVHAESNENSPQIIVSAGRTDTVSIQHASNITVISREEIENSGARNLADLLRGRPGIFISDPFGDGSNASIDMRGFGSTANANTLVMIDGRKLNFASDMGALYLNNVNLDNVRQVEIIQGSAGILYGNMAVGGVVNIITGGPTQSAFEIGLGLGSYDSQQITSKLSQLLGDGWSLRANINQRTADNYRDNNESNINTAGMRLYRDYSAGSLFLEVDYLDEFLQTPGALFLDEIAVDRRQSAAVYANDFQDLQSYTYRAGIEHQVASEWLLSVEASYEDDERNAFQSFRSGFGYDLRQTRETWNLNPKLVGNFTDYQLTLGLDYQQTDYLLTTFGLLSDQDVDQTIYGIYGQAVFNVRDDLDVIAGIRQARVENDIEYSGSFDLDDDVTIGLLGVNYTPFSGWRIFVRADQNYRFAKVDEHTNLLGPPGELENQKGITYEAGVQFSDNSYSGGLQVYQLEIDDEISFDASGFFPVNVNLDKTTRQGIAFNSQFLLGDNWIAGFNYDFVDAEVTAGPHDGKLIPLVPENRARVFAEYSPSSELTMMLDAVYVDQQVYGGDYDNDYSKLDNFTVLNLAGLYLQSGWSVSWRINNLLNEEYSESGSIGLDAMFNEKPAEFTAPERNVSVMLKVEL